MTMSVQNPDRIEMSQRERDLLWIMHPVLRGERTQAQAADLLGITARQVRRIQRELEARGDRAAVNGLEGRPPNHRPDHGLERPVPRAYRGHHPDFGPAPAAEKLAEIQSLSACGQALRRWLLEANLWERHRRREPHRRRRPRRACFGELVQQALRRAEVTGP